MLIGYARISPKSQKLDRQIDILNDYGCEKIYSDVAAVDVMDRCGSLSYWNS